MSLRYVEGDPVGWELMENKVDLSQSPDGDGGKECVVM